MRYLLSDKGSAAMKAFIRKYFPGTMRVMGSVKNTMLDSVDVLFKRRDDLAPPRRLMFVGSGDYRKTGTEFFGYFKELGGLEPDDRVLDVGCGIGRMAVPLLDYLSEEGSYDGFDIVPLGIQWCTDNISCRREEFQFRLVDICNKEYNPNGQVSASEFRFPYPDNRFDLVVLTSVFTHMLPDEVANYLAEIRRVMKPGSKCLISWFLLNDESEQGIRERRSSLDFTFPVGNCLSTNAETPEEAICYRQDDVLGLYEEVDLHIEPPVHLGSWCGREQHVSFQDICIAHRDVDS
jgi:SAM-dependent methyltransferase